MAGVAMIAIRRAIGRLVRLFVAMQAGHLAAYRVEHNGPPGAKLDRESGACFGWGNHPAGRHSGAHQQGHQHQRGDGPEHGKTREQALAHAAPLASRHEPGNCASVAHSKTALRFRRAVCSFR